MFCLASQNVDSLSLLFVFLQNPEVAMESFGKLDELFQMLRFRRHSTSYLFSFSYEKWYFCEHHKRGVSPEISLMSLLFQMFNFESGYKEWFIGPSRNVERIVQAFNCSIIDVLTFAMWEIKIGRNRKYSTSHNLQQQLAIIDINRWIVSLLCDKICGAEVPRPTLDTLRWSKPIL